VESGWPFGSNNDDMQLDIATFTLQRKLRETDCSVDIGGSLMAVTESSVE
jgi:hypothetical protein